MMALYSPVPPSSIVRESFWAIATLEKLARIQSRDKHCINLIFCRCLHFFMIFALTGVDCICWLDRKSTRLNSSHVAISYAVFCLKKKIKKLRAHDWYKT